MRLFGRTRRAEPRAAPALPPGLRAYAVGDVHGRLDLLDDLLGRIEVDDRARGEAETHLVLLGDLIDRGPESAGVVERLRAVPPAFTRLHLIMGNHEEMLMRLLDEPEAGTLARFLHYGGYETLQSYGVPARMLDLPSAFPPEALLRFVPDAHRAFLATFEDQVRLGDYLFVHAGIRPGVAIDAQKPSDLRWIRAPFLDSADDHGVTVVHGHTIAPRADRRDNRIGIDTGAYATGVLTALGLEGEAQWLLATEAPVDRD